MRLTAVLLLGLAAAKHHHKDHALVQKPATGEATKILAQAKEGLADLEKNDASLSDMLQFSKVIANGKTVDEAVEEEKL